MFCVGFSQDSKAEPVYCRGIRAGTNIGSMSNQTGVPGDKFSPVEACRMVSTNPARCLGIADQTGRLAEGFTADIAVLANDQLTVRKTFVEGICVYEQN